MEEQNFNLVCKEGKASEDGCLEAWEEIVRINGEQNNNYEYFNFLNLLKSYKKLVNEQSLVTAALLKLHMVLDRPLAKEITKRGYKIILSTDPDPSIRAKLYADSLDAAVSKLRGLKAKIKMKENEIKLFQGEHKKQEGTFEKLMAQLVYYSKAHVDDNITLARYNEIMKIMKEEHKPRER